MNILRAIGKSTEILLEFDVLPTAKARQASAWLTWAAYIPMAEARGFTPRFGKGSTVQGLGVSSTDHN
jgi:hypothetical protein